MSTTLLDRLQAENEELRCMIRRFFEHIDDRAAGWDKAKGPFGDCEFGARHEARAIAAQLREIVAVHALGSKAILSEETVAEIRQTVLGVRG